MTGTIATASNYIIKNGPLKDPKFLTITSAYNAGIYDIAFGISGDIIHVNNVSGVLLSYTKGLSVEINSEYPLILSVTLGILQFEDINNYNIGDNYVLYLDDMIQSQMALSVNVTRAKSNQFGNKSLISLPSLTPLLTPLTPLTPLITFPIEVPIINIHGQTTIDGEYLSDMTFDVQDKYSYKSHENIVKKCKCKKHFATNLKTTIFHKNNIPLQCVVKGKGSLANKVNNIMVNLGETNYDIFLESFLQYTMLKYVLINNFSKI